MTGYISPYISGLVNPNPLAAVSTTPAIAGTEFSPTGMQQLLGYRNPTDGSFTNGWGGLALGGLSAFTNAFMGMKQYGLAKDTLNFNKKQFGMNWDAQAKTTNAQLADRQAARLSADPNNANGYASVADYMSKYGIKPYGG